MLLIVGILSTCFVFTNDVIIWTSLSKIYELALPSLIGNLVKLPVVFDDARGASPISYPLLHLPIEECAMFLPVFGCQASTACVWLAKAYEVDVMGSVRLLLRLCLPLE